MHQIRGLTDSPRFTGSVTYEPYQPGTTTMVVQGERERKNLWIWLMVGEVSLVVLPDIHDPKFSFMPLVLTDLGRVKYSILFSSICSRRTIKVPTSMPRGMEIIIMHCSVLNHRAILSGFSLALEVSCSHVELPRDLKPGLKQNVHYSLGPLSRVHDFFSRGYFSSCRREKRNRQK